jgi:ferritin-like metal-binding protein YciE
MDGDRFFLGEGSIKGKYSDQTMDDPSGTLTPPNKRLKSGHCKIHKMLVLRKEVMELNTLQDLYVHELKDLYSAEKQLIKAIPKMEKAAKNKELANGFEEHLEQTKEHAQRLERVLSSLGQTTRGPKCKGMAGIVAEGAEMIEEEGDDEVKDAGLIAAAQRVEHYEIAGYGTARTYAELLDDKEGAKLLTETFEEEKETDQKLTKLAKSAINVAAAGK